MKKASFILLILLLGINALSLSAQKKYEIYSVGFYNIENLFDTIHDKGKNDSCRSYQLPHQAGGSCFRSGVQRGARGSDRFRKIQEPRPLRLQPQ